jgi:hypothetical protein
MSPEIDRHGTPRRAFGLHLESEGDDAVLVDATGRRVARLNEPAAALWDLCDGRTTVQEMIDACVELFGGDSDQMVIDVTEAMRRMTEARVLIP